MEKRRKCFLCPKRATYLINSGRYATKNLCDSCALEELMSHPLDTAMISIEYKAKMDKKLKRG